VKWATFRRQHKTATAQKAMPNSAAISLIERRFPGTETVEIGVQGQGFFS
jgi:hypothetical protein